MFLGLCTGFPFEPLSLPFQSLLLKSLPLPYPLRTLPLETSSLPFGSLRFGRARDAPGLSRERDLSLLLSCIRIRGLDLLLPLSRDCDTEPPPVLPRDLDLLTLSVLSSGSPTGVFSDL